MTQCKFVKKAIRSQTLMTPIQTIGKIFVTDVEVKQRRNVPIVMKILGGSIMWMELLAVLVPMFLLIVTNVVNHIHGRPEPQ